MIPRSLSGRSSERSLAADRRAVTPLVGFILLFGILVAAFVLYQTQVVPIQNEEVEFVQSQESIDDMDQLRAAVMGSAVTDRGPSRTAVQVRLGTQYPPRLIAVNPPRHEGQLGTSEGTLNITGATVTDPDEFTGDPDSTLLTDHETRLVSYRPSFTEYDGAPVTYLEHSLLFNQHPAPSEENLTVTNQTVVDSTNGLLDLVVLDGSLEEQGLRTSVDVTGLDGPSATVPVEATADEEFTITFSTNSPAVWESNQTIGSTFDSGETGARAERTGTDEVTITVDDTHDDWELRMTRVGLEGGERTDEFSEVSPVGVDVAGPDIDVDQDDETVSEGETVDISGEVSALDDGTTDRTGTPIRQIVAEPDGEETQVLFEWHDQREEAEFTFDSEVDTDVDGIDTTGWDGETETLIRAQDATGQWSVGDRDSITITIADPENGE